MMLKNVLLALLCSQGVGRDVVNFDFAWRFNLDADESSNTELTPPESAGKFDDSKWNIVDAPHDMLIDGKYDKTNSNKRAFLAMGNGWYRKHFSVPLDWNGSAIWFYTEGIFHATTVWLNGKQLGFHPQGYTSFWYRLDDKDVKYSDGPGTDENVIAIFVNASSGTGWWYEGGGLTRHQYLVRTSPVFMPPHGSWAYADMTKAKVLDNGNTPGDGLSATGVIFKVESTVRNGLTKPIAGVGIDVKFDDACDPILRVEPEMSATLPPAADYSFTVVAECRSPVQLWSVARPALHIATLSVTIAGKQMDSQNISFGARAIRFDANKGLYLNGKQTKMRGFCDHSNFGGVGAAVPDRVNLFRTQALRAVGGNAWRMAHNDPIPIRLDIMDHLGMMAMDENRDYGGKKGQGGYTDEDVTQELHDMADMVLRDRSHPSIILWSFCNEVGCDNETAAKDFRNVTLSLDKTRPVTQNHLGDGDHPLSMLSLDVQGMSHKDGDVMDKFHKNNPDKPIVASECCSCLSQRGVDADFCPEPKDGGSENCHDALGHGGQDGVFYNNEIAKCTADQVAWSDLREFNSGTFVWSGFDYLGESRGWPQVGKARGTVADLAGFSKESRWWFKSWWFSNISQVDHGKPILWPGADEHGPTVYIPESWVPLKNKKTRTIHVYTNAPFVRLLVNGRKIGDNAIPFFGFATFADVAYEAGNVTAEALDMQRNSLGSQYTIRTPKFATSIRLSLDAPSPLTGTGSSLVSDGEDVAMVRAELVDENSRLVTQDASAFFNVTFTVVSGAGRLIAVHSGNPASQQRGDTVAAYHGLARAFVRSSEDCATSMMHRSLLRRIDGDSGKGSSSQISSSDCKSSLPPIVVQAHAPGLPLAHLSIPLSTNLMDLPIGVAMSQASARLQEEVGISFV